jgi:hypothetical protein
LPTASTAKVFQVDVVAIQAPQDHQAQVVVVVALQLLF